LKEETLDCTRGELSLEEAMDLFVVRLRDDDDYDDDNDNDDVN
jgi:hypothetical protein